MFLLKRRMPQNRRVQCRRTSVPVCEGARESLRADGGIEHERLFNEEDRHHRPWPCGCARRQQPAVAGHRRRAVPMRHRPAETHVRGAGSRGLPFVRAVQHQDRELRGRLRGARLLRHHRECRRQGCPGGRLTRRRALLHHRRVPDVRRSRGARGLRGRVGHHRKPLRRRCHRDPEAHRLRPAPRDRLGHGARLGALPLRAGAAHRIRPPSPSRPT